MRIISTLLASLQVFGQTTTQVQYETSAAPTDGPIEGPEGYCDAERCDLHSDLIFDLQDQMNDLKAENEDLRKDVEFLKGWG